MKDLFGKARPSKWKFISHVSMATTGTRLEGRTWRGIQLRKETTTRRADGSWGKAKTIYCVKDQRKSIQNNACFYLISQV